MNSSLMAFFALFYNCSKIFFRMYDFIRNRMTRSFILFTLFIFVRNSKFRLTSYFLSPDLNLNYFCTPGETAYELICRTSSGASYSVYSIKLLMMSYGCKTKYWVFYEINKVNNMKLFVILFPTIFIIRFCFIQNQSYLVYITLKNEYFQSIFIVILEPS